jgi:acetylornithine deacetylase/succinyl-diaminopimelate desuccinylase-like protein
VTTKVLQRLADDRAHAIERLMHWLTIPSVSADPACVPSVRKAADWTADHLRQSGLAVDIMPTAGHPAVVARTTPQQAPDNAPRILFYGHYDVQPPDPLDLWHTPPFAPTIRNDAIHARGASDDKGQVACFLEALRAWMTAEGGLPVHVTVLIEGEEEIGSINLPAFVERHRDLLAADVVVVSDTGMWDPPGDPVPAITYGLRGLVYFDLKLFGPKRDLHSGVYGGTMANPATMLTRVLGRLFDENNRVTVPGFYDDVVPLGDDERRQWEQLGFDERAYLDDVGVSQPFGEAGYATLERRWVRPSCDINGLYGGYMGEGAKTVIPSFAGAKLSCRLAANQDPAKIARQLVAWLESQDVGGCRWRITPHGEAHPVLADRHSPHMAAALRAFEQAAGRKPVLIREGATIPIVADFKRLLGLDTLLVGFGLGDDCLHSPNEKFNLAQFDLGCRTHALLLAELGRTGLKPEPLSAPDQR